ncbi:RING-H2 finger protein ATL1-like [Triticum dicoccoides]|uniref:RING-H2 finger protein ATL1-like n=1 Tax=Triticum dicoccoides TaxID=85692 RepID=UPI0018918CD7|nr:RING-H2 finger protein ATL1-like [Triticum dicoccoides]
MAPVFPVPQRQAPSSTLLFAPPQTPFTPYYYSSSSPATSSRLTHHVTLSLTSLPILVLTVLGILTTSALLLTYYVLVIRCCLTWHGTTADSSSPSSGASGSLVISLTRRRHRRNNTPSDHELPVVHGPTPDEPCTGLGESAIRALPAFRYTKAAKDDAATGGDASECAVCLGEFQEGERVRLLPGCLHVFHAECIDTWLQGCANCPLCRAAITGKQAPLTMDRPPRREEVVIQVQVAGTGEEEDTPREHGTAASKSSTHFHGECSGGSSNEAHCSR